MAECSLGGKRMKKIVILFFVVLASLATYAQDNLQFPIEPTMAKEWKYLSDQVMGCLLYTSPSPRDRTRSRMPSSA